MAPMRKLGSHHGPGTAVTGALVFLVLFAQVVVTSSVSPQCTLGISSPPSVWLPVGNCSIVSSGGSNIDSWGSMVSVGSASQQICVTPSTVVNITVLMGSELCNSTNRITPSYNESLPQCLSRCGGVIDSSALPSASTDGLASENPGWAGIMNSSTPFNDAVNASFLLRAGNAVMMQAAVETFGNNHTASQLGLANSSVLLQALVDANLITSRSWGLNPGSQSLLYPRPGNIVFGGYDDSSVLGSFTEYRIGDTSLGNRDCPLQVQIESMALKLSDTSSKSIFGSDHPLTACIEPYDNLFRLPSDEITYFQSLYRNITGSSGTLDPIPDPADPNLLDLEPGLIYPYFANSTGTFNGSLVITLENDFTVEIPSYELQRPLRGLAPNGSRILNTDFTEVQIYETADPEDAAVLGKIFLSMVYLYVDYDAGVFKLANINPQATGAPTIVVGNSTICAQASSSGLAPVAIGLIVVSVVVALLAVAVAWLLYGRYRARRAAAAAATQQSAGDTKDEDAKDSIANAKGELAPEVTQMGDPGTRQSALAATDITRRTTRGSHDRRAWGSLGSIPDVDGAAQSEFEGTTVAAPTDRPAEVDGRQRFSELSHAVSNSNTLASPEAQEAPSPAVGPSERQRNMSWASELASP